MTFLSNEPSLKDYLDSDKYLTKEELKTLYNLLKYQYISYENIAAIQLVRKIRDILCQHG